MILQNVKLNRTLILGEKVIIIKEALDNSLGKMTGK